MRQLYVTDEGRYVTLDHVRERIADALDREATDFDCEMYLIVHRLTPATCNVCTREIPEDATLPLCRTCEGSARAHARVDREHEAWVADGSPR